MAKKTKLKHIQVKDNGIKLSNKIGDQLNDIKVLLENTIITNLVKGLVGADVTRYRITQNNLLRQFKREAKGLIAQASKSVKNSLKDDKTVNLSKTQALHISHQIDKGMLLLEKSAVLAYQSTVTNVVLKSKSAEQLHDQLEKHIQSGLNIGVVYQDGKNFQFDTYWEMKARTDIQQDIGTNMIEAGNTLGVIFYITSYYGDCAKDHADYQGKIYYDKDWKSNAPKDRIEEIQNYIDSNKLMSVQEVMGAPVFLTTRPNCRHYFQYIDIDSVLGAKTEKQVSQLRDQNNLNFNGKYKPEKYDALQKQRLNERRIRAQKQEIQKQEQLLALNPGDTKIQSKIQNGEAKVRKIQEEQRSLIKQHDNLERRYDREALGNRVDLGVGK